MKEKILKFIGTGYKDKCQAKVSIYDINNNLIYEEKTYNGKIEVCLEENNVYKLKAKLCNETINLCFYVSCDRNVYTFIFDRSIAGRRVTFLLRDYYYNLEIEKGEIILWQK